MSSFIYQKHAYAGGVIVHVKLHGRSHCSCRLRVIVHGSVHVVTWAYSARVIVHGLTGVPYAMNYDPAPIVD